MRKDFVSSADASNALKNKMLKHAAVAELVDAPD